MTTFTVHLKTGRTHTTDLRGWPLTDLIADLADGRDFVKYGFVDDTGHYVEFLPSDLTSVEVTP